MKKARGKRTQEIIFELEDSPEGGYEAHALGFSIYTEADNLDELKAMIKDAVECHFFQERVPDFKIQMPVF